MTTKRETWNELITLVYIGNDLHWADVHAVMDKSQAAVACDKMNAPCTALSRTPLDKERRDWKVEYNAAPGVVFHEPDPPQRLFWEVLTTGGQRVLHEGPERIWLEALDDGTVVPLGTGDLMRWPLEKTGVVKVSEDAGVLLWAWRCDVVRMVAGD